MCKYKRKKKKRFWLKFLKYFHVLPNCYSHDYVILLQKINTFGFIFLFTSSGSGWS